MQINLSKSAYMGISVIRIITGILLVYHGIEVFNSKTMADYAQWEMFKNSGFGLILVYLGKGAELLAGLMLVLGFYTKIASIIVVITMLGIVFFVGHGKFWYEDQHPFLFALLAILFYFLGGGKWSIKN